MEFKYAMKGEDGSELFQDCVLMARQFLGSGQWEVWDLRPEWTKFCKECSSDAERLVRHEGRCPKVVRRNNVNEERAALAREARAKRPERRTPGKPKAAQKGARARPKGKAGEVVEQGEEEAVEEKDAVEEKEVSEEEEVEQEKAARSRKPRPKRSERVPGKTKKAQKRAQEEASASEEDLDLDLEEEVVEEEAPDPVSTVAPFVRSCDPVLTQPSLRWSSGAAERLRLVRKSQAPLSPALTLTRHAVSRTTSMQSAIGCSMNTRKSTARPPPAGPGTTSMTRPRSRWPARPLGLNGDEPALASMQA